MLAGMGTKQKRGFAGDIATLLCKWEFTNMALTIFILAYGTAMEINKHGKKSVVCVQRQCGQESHC